MQYCAGRRREVVIEWAVAIGLVCVWVRCNTHSAAGEAGSADAPRLGWLLC